MASIYWWICCFNIGMLVERACLTQFSLQVSPQEKSTAKRLDKQEASGNTQLHHLALLVFMLSVHWSLVNMKHWSDQDWIVAVELFIKTYSFKVIQHVFKQLDPCWTNLSGVAFSFGNTWRPKTCPVSISDLKLWIQQGLKLSLTTFCNV